MIVVYSNESPAGTDEVFHDTDEAVGTAVLEVERVVRSSVLLHQLQRAAVLLDLVAAQLAQLYTHRLHETANCTTFSCHFKQQHSFRQSRLFVKCLMT